MHILLGLSSIELGGIGLGKVVVGSYVPPDVHTREFIEEDLHERRYVVVEDLGNNALECRRRRFKPEHHYFRNKNAPLGDESGFLLVLGVHSNLIISAETIEKAIAFMPRYRVENAIREWKREAIRDRGRVEFPIVHTDSYFPVLLWNDYYRA